MDSGCAAAFIKDTPHTIALGFKNDAFLVTLLQGHIVLWFSQRAAILCKICSHSLDAVSGSVHQKRLSAVSIVHQKPCTPAGHHILPESFYEPHLLIWKKIHWRQCEYTDDSAQYMVLHFPALDPVSGQHFCCTFTAIVASHCLLYSYSSFAFPLVFRPHSTSSSRLCFPASHDTTPDPHVLSVLEMVSHLPHTTRFRQNSCIAQAHLPNNFQISGRSPYPY